MTNRTLMAVGAHADDIELNAGGTLSKYRRRGYGVVYVMSTNNMSGGWSRLNPDGSVDVAKPPWFEIMPQRKVEAKAAAQAFGTEPIHLDHPQRHYARPDGATAEVRYGCDRPEGVPPDAPTILTAHEHQPSVQRVADLILEHKPEAVLTHGLITGDMEHSGTCLLTTKAYWKAVAAGHDGMLLHWRDLSQAPVGDAYGGWDTFVDVTEHWREKLAAIALHACQMPDVNRLDFPPWGAACGCGHAEVFVLVGRGRCPAQGAEFSAEVLSHVK